MAQFKIEEGFYQSVNLELIRFSFNQVRAVGPLSIAKVYEYVFADYPESIPLFAGVNWPHQYQSMLDALGFVIDNMDNEDVVRRYLFDLGVRHVKYGAADFNYEWVGNSVLKGLGFFYQDDWTTELSGEWRKFFVVVKAMMMDGHNSVMTGQELRS